MITDGEGIKLGIDVDSLLLFETKNQSLKKILYKILDEVAAIQTKGDPPQHVVSPDSIKNILAIKSEIDKTVK